MRPVFSLSISFLLLFCPLDLLGAPYRNTHFGQQDSNPFVHFSEFMHVFHMSPSSTLPVPVFVFRLKHKIGYTYRNNNPENLTRYILYHPFTGDVYLRQHFIVKQKFYRLKNAELMHVPMCLFLLPQQRCNSIKQID